MRTWEVHPLADLFPSLSDADYEALKADIAEQGVLTPIVLWNGKLIDGRHRMRAANELGKDYDTVTLACAECDLPKKVAAYNLHRRHLTISQRSMIAHEMEALKIGRPKSDLQDQVSGGRPVTRQQAAEVMGVSYPMVTRAARVARESPPEVVAAVKSGEMTLTSAHSRIAKERSRQRPAATPRELQRVPGKQKGESFERTLAAIETHVETLTEIWDSVTPTGDWLNRLRGVRRRLATITHDLEKAAA